MGEPKSGSRALVIRDVADLLTAVSVESGGQSVGEPLVRVDAPEFALRAMRACEEISHLAPLAIGYGRAIAKGLEADSRTTYNIVKYGLDTVKLLRACTTLLELVVELQAFDKGPVE